MKRQGIFWILICITAGFFMASTPPEVVNYQGVLRDAAGNALDGTYDMAFRFYDGADSGADTLLLTDTHAAAGSGAVTVSGGLFSVGLGSGTLTPGTETGLYGVFRNNAAVFVEVQIGAETLAPLVEIRSTGFAINAAALEGQGSDDFLSAVNNDTAQGKISITGLPTSSIFSSGTLAVNPASATTDYTLIGAGVNGNQRMRLDAEGDLSLFGGASLGNSLAYTSAASGYLITVENDNNSGAYWDASANRWYWHWNSSPTIYFDLDQGIISGGNLNITGSSTLGTSNGDWLTLNALVNGNVVPSQNANFNLGAAGQSWDDVFVSGSVRFSGPDQMLLAVEGDNDSGVFWDATDNQWEWLWNGVSRAQFDLDSSYLRLASDLQAYGDTYLGNTTADRIIIAGLVSSNIVPDFDANRDLGTSSLRWQDLYLSGDIKGSGGTPLYLKKDVVESTSGRFTFSGTPTSTAISGGSLYVNPSTAAGGTTLFGVAVAGTQRFKVNEDGDVDVAGTLEAEGQIIAGNNGSFSGSSAIHVDHNSSGLGSKAVQVRYDYSNDAGLASAVQSTAWALNSSNTSVIRALYGIASGSATSAGTHYGVYGDATGTNSADHYGVYGEATDSVNNSYGVVGQSDDIPLEARDDAGTAVLSTAASGLTTMLELQVSNDAGVGAAPVTSWALNVDQSSATLGTGGVKADGAYGPTRGYLAAQGNTDFDGITTLDISGQEMGVLGVSIGSSNTDNFGLFGYSNGVGVRAVHSVDEDSWANMAVTNYGIDAHGGLAGGLFTDSTSSNWATVGGDTTKVEGPGSVAFVQNHPFQRDKVVVYHAPESAEVATYTRGSARLENGEAIVDLDPTFAWVTNPGLGLTVQLTPRGQWADLFVANIDTGKLVVRSRDGSADGVEFDYMVHGLRIGFEEVSIVKPKRYEARIPNMGEHQKRFNQNPGLYQYTAMARFETNREALGRGPQENLEERQELLQAIGIFDRSIHPIPTLPKKSPFAIEDPVHETTPAIIPAPASNNQVVGHPAGGLSQGHDKIRVDQEGNLYATSFRPDQSQIAQNQAVTGQVEAGDVMVVNRAAPDQLIPCAEEADPGVVGIAVASPGLGLKDGQKGHDQEGQAPLALGGVVLCKVDASQRAIRIGDLLVTSATPGHAQGMEDPAPGTVVGKALEEIEEGTGLIRVLVMLR